MSIGGQSEASQAKSEQKIYRLTPEGFAKKKERLEYLRTVKRKEIADYIHEAKELGDMHDDLDGPPVVRIGMEVDVQSDSGSVRTFKIVETFEADPKSGLISDQALVGKALMEHREGDSISVSTPGGVTNYTIRSIRPML